MAIYRDLFYNNIQGFLANNFPVIRKLYPDERWHALVRDFFVRHRARTPLFPELPREFLQFVEEQRGEEHGDPPFLLELAHYEWIELALSLDEAEIDSIDVDPDGDLLEGVPVRSPLAWLLTYRFPVHQIRPDFQPQHAPEQPTHLVVYRRRDDKVRFMSVNAVAARLLQLLDDQPERTGRIQLEQIASELNSADPGKVVAAGRQVLEDFRTREIVLGTALN